MSDLTDLTAENERLKEQLEIETSAGFKIIRENLDVKNALNAKLEKVKDLSRKINGYASHDKNCASNGYLCNRKHCDCGYKEVLDELNATDGNELMWCAMCGKMTDHRSGGCSQSQMSLNEHFDELVMAMTDDEVIAEYNRLVKESIEKNGLVDVKLIYPFRPNITVADLARGVLKLLHAPTTEDKEFF